MKITREIVQELDDKVKPDTFLVLTIRQGVQIAGGGFMPPEEHHLDRVVRRFLVHLAYRLHGERRCKRQRIKIANISTLEGRYGTLWHINICLRRPDGVSIEQLEIAAKAAWFESRWALPNIYVKEIVGSALPYILKEGTDALLTESTHF